MKSLRVLLIMMVVCGLAAYPGLAAAKTLKIGSMSPLTGQYAADGNDIRQGVETAIAMWEKKGGVPGYDKIKYYPQDSACDGKQAVSSANKLVNLEVAGVIGAYCSSATIPASDVLNDAKIVMLTPASTNEKVTERGFKYMFRVCGRDDDQSKAAAKFLINRLKIKTVAIVDDKTTYTQGLADNLEKALGGKVKVVAREHINQGDKDFSGVLTKIKALDPDVLYMSLYNPEGNLMAIQAKRLGLRATLMSEDAVYHPNYLKIAKEAGEGTYFTFGQPPSKSIPEVKAFLDAYTAKYGEPGSYSSYAYDAANILLSAIAKVGADDPDKLAEAIRATKMQGASKFITFDEKGDSGSTYKVLVVKGGKFVPFWDPETGKDF
ncbi:MAG: branched-chain amino acid ABC transporter substrate-binding protein [Deltaproteobacteria bacterium]|nr:branched-chain amino acid ABC transporter substrate-binding protein [Deltaproteobacteria bacterium]MBW2129304.1 branched-chain amino acid ABC transporter substrate-binding protein [Deltaproteobacteria bacterium]MBW2304209.1 branched-chain amino acid ABC transporter substrate-binding protein [Deltaproteobacteria bacterium]